MTYRLSKCRRILKQGCALYKKKSEKLSEHNRAHLANALEKLDEALLKKERLESDSQARVVANFMNQYFPKSFFDHAVELVSALLFAIVFAFIIRQFWFELYEVPTGSMRPTIEELDRLVVSKSTFGINLPLQKDLILFKPEYIKRAGAVVFTVEGMEDVVDSDAVYFYLFPGKKRFVKRSMAKPGDTIYFYGGRIYGIDSEGNPFTELSDDTFLTEVGLSQIDHVPYINLDGKTSLSKRVGRETFSETTIKQMDIPIGKMTIENPTHVESQFFNGIEWTKEDINALKKPHKTPVSYSDLWGIGNYAMARLLNRNEVERFYGSNAIQKSDDTLLYLELRHTPNLTYPQPEIRRGESGRAHPLITPFVTFIPLKENHIEALQKALYTARFFIKDGHAYRYQEGRNRPQPPDYDPLFPSVPDGCYEFYYGKGYKIHVGGIRTELSKDHPLYSTNIENIEKLFNLGIGFNLLFQPHGKQQAFYPQRFAYFRDGDLYVMGAPILKKDDPTLSAFITKELEHQEKSIESAPYIAFIDHGAPLKEKSLDIEFIKAFGLKIPEDRFLALGDNYAMSADSRDFGLVPVSKLRGSPSFTFWPPGERLGSFPQAHYPWITVPNLIIWILALIVAVIAYIYIHKRNNRRYFKR